MQQPLRFASQGEACPCGRPLGGSSYVTRSGRAVRPSLEHAPPLVEVPPELENSVRPESESAALPEPPPETQQEPEEEAQQPPQGLMEREGPPQCASPSSGEAVGVAPTRSLQRLHDMLDGIAAQNGTRAAERLFWTRSPMDVPAETSYEVGRAAGQIGAIATQVNALVMAGRERRHRDGLCGRRTADAVSQGGLRGHGISAGAPEGEPWRHHATEHASQGGLCGHAITDSVLHCLRPCGYTGANAPPCSGLQLGDNRRAKQIWTRDGKKEARETRSRWQTAATQRVPVGLLPVRESWLSGAASPGERRGEEPAQMVARGRERVPLQRGGVDAAAQTWAAPDALGGWDAELYAGFPYTREVLAERAGLVAVVEGAPTVFLHAHLSVEDGTFSIPGLLERAQPERVWLARPAQGALALAPFFVSCAERGVLCLATVSPERSLALVTQLSALVAAAPAPTPPPPKTLLFARAPPPPAEPSRWNRLLRNGLWGKSVDPVPQRAATARHASAELVGSPRERAKAVDVFGYASAGSGGVAGPKVAATTGDPPPKTSPAEAAPRTYLGALGSKASFWKRGVSFKATEAAEPEPPQPDGAPDYEQVLQSLQTGLN